MHMACRICTIEHASLDLIYLMQALVDDNLVHQDKIGISNFFWSFPSEAAVEVSTPFKADCAQLFANQLRKFSMRCLQVQSDIDRAETQLQDNEQQIAKLADQVDKSKVGKDFSVCSFFWVLQCIGLAA